MSCLFNTLCTFVNLEGEELRHNICNYLSNNPKMFENVSAEDYVKWNNEGYNNINEYIRDMKKNYTWGGAIEIKAFCNMYNKHVNVHDVRTRKQSVINFIDEDRVRDTIDINWNGGHYWPK